MTANDNLAHSRQAPRRTQPAGFGWADIIGPFAALYAYLGIGLAYPIRSSTAPTSTALSRRSIGGPCLQSAQARSCCTGCSCRSGARYAIGSA